MPADRGLPLRAKVLALSLLAAPWPALASVVAWSASGRALGHEAAVALGPGAVGSLLLACTGFLAARRVAAAADALLRQSERIRDGIREGDFDVQTDPALVEPVLRPILRAMHETVEAFAVPFEHATSALAGIARGELPEPIAESHGGEFDRQRDAVNAIVRFVQLRAEDICLLVGGVTRHGGGAPDEAVAGEGRS